VQQWFGANLRRLRESRNLSATELARGVDCHITHISRAEAGSYTPGADFVYRVAQLLGVTTDDLLLPPEKPRPQLTLGQRLDRALADERLSRPEQAAVEVLVDAVIGQAQLRDMAAQVRR
jgi:transcriptional regulator with XRE-family HTH domain